MNPKYPRIADRAGHRCEYCRAPEVVFNIRFEVEHITPIVDGGSSDDDNLALACRAYNSLKSSLVEGIDPDTGSIIRLFHPRIDHWESHFVVDVETGQIVGTTAIGRATVSLLQVNSPRQTMARKLWIRFKLIP